jgi:hypothetical protein
VWQGSVSLTGMGISLRQEQNNGHSNSWGVCDSLPLDMLFEDNIYSRQPWLPRDIRGKANRRDLGVGELLKFIGIWFGQSQITNFLSQGFVSDVF